MKKSTIGIIVAGVVAIGAALLLVGCVGKSKVNSPSDVVITNTYQVKDISKNKIVQEEARQRLIAMMAENNLKPDGEVKFVKTLAYNRFGNDHYIAMSFKTKVVGYSKPSQALSYLNIRESSGQYTVIDSFHILSGHPETDDEYKEAYSEVMKSVRTCGGSLPNTATAE